MQTDINKFASSLPPPPQKAGFMDATVTRPRPRRLRPRRVGKT
jgi:hypothetical protein